MFEHAAEDIRLDPAAKTFHLVHLRSQTLNFSDRPLRMTGNVPLSVYMKSWTDKAGPNSVAADPDNARPSIQEPGQNRNTLVVVGINRPVADGKDLTYSYKLVKRMLPTSSGETAIVIDWIGPGGGVGPGYHGVGLGTRGVGLYGGYSGPAREVPELFHQPA